ncbi:hypothetical protein UFOVP1360_40 [uncultured Caudovirales phage]|uniref:Uncharacterized protein n=1 Tax=uncultured Caudovirales phage TaxID=2100421 RepID=A0A6J5RUA9_9CAUD|nr:hypothetical protein UFOVP1360_40 [uncultured Caudovirales phage]
MNEDTRADDARIDLLCEHITAHIREQWPTAPGRSEIDAYLTKLTEEVGELSGALVKLQQGRTDDNWYGEAVKEFGDVMIVLAQVAHWLDTNDGRSQPGMFTMTKMLRRRWASVSKRKGADYRSVKDGDQLTLPPELIPTFKREEVIPRSDPRHPQYGDATGPGHA